MNLSNNVVLITGGSSGLGLELAQKLAEKNNKVLVCGRNLKKLQNAKASLPSIDYFQCDISKVEDCYRLENWIKENYPDCNVLVNNAAIVNISNFDSNDNILAEAREEIETNLMAPIVLCKLFLPRLRSNANPHIINITTGLIYAPKADYPFYNATKAAVHSFTQVLRKQLEQSEIKVTEVMFPAVDTPWHNGKAPKIAITAQQAIQHMLKGLVANKKEIRVAGASKLYKISRIAPAFAFKIINKITNK